MTACTICRSPGVRAQVDAGHLEGRTLRDLGKAAGVSKDAVHRHLERCAAREMAEARRATAAVRGGSLRGKIEELEQMVRGIFDEAREDGDRRSALAAARELVRMLELDGRASGELPQGAEEIDDLRALETEQIEEVVRDALAELDRRRSLGAEAPALPAPEIALPLESTGILIEPRAEPEHEEDDPPDVVDALDPDGLDTLDPEPEPQPERRGPGSAVRVLP